MPTWAQIIVSKYSTDYTAVSDYQHRQLSTTTTYGSSLVKIINVTNSNNIQEQNKRTLQAVSIDICTACCHCMECACIFSGPMRNGYSQGEIIDNRTFILYNPFVVMVYLQ
jgi:hypothetical protein